MAAAKKTLSPEQLALQTLGSLLADPGPKPIAEIFKAKAVKPGEAVALANGWLEPTGEFVESGKGKSKKRLELYRLSAKGVAALVHTDDDKQLLGVLRGAIESLSVRPTGVDPEKERQLTKLTAEVSEQCAGLRHEVAEAVKTLQAQADAVTRQLTGKLGEIRANLSGGAGDGSALRQAMTLLADKLKPINIDELARKMGTPAAAPVATPTTGADWLDTVVTMVNEQKRQNAFQSLTLKEIYDRLRATHPQLTLGQYHDGMRRLHKERRVRLAPYTQALATLPDPSVALYLDNEVKYYVQVAL